MFALLLAAALVSSTNAKPSFAYGAVALGYQIPTGSFYDGDFGAGLAFHAAFGVRPVPLAALEADLMLASGGVRRSTPDAQFRSVGIGVRGFVPLSPSVEGTVALGYSPSFTTQVGPLGLYGYSTDLSAGIRVGHDSKWRVTIDGRYSFARFTRGSVSGASGSLGHQKHGDIGAILLGTLLRF